MMDASKDCMSYARPSRVVCEYFVSGFPGQVYSVGFARLADFDDWRYQKTNQNKVVISLHITYQYGTDYLSENGCILK